MAEVEKAEPKNITLYPTETEIVERVQIERRIKTFSAAIQFIILDWNERRQSDTRKGK